MSEMCRLHRHLVFWCMECLPSNRCWNNTFHFIMFTTVSQLNQAVQKKAHAACIMSPGYSAAIKSCLFSSAQEKKKKACDMFIKQQGSHYCTQQSLSQCSHIVACTCSLGTVRLIVSLLSHAVHSFQFLTSVSFSTCLSSPGGTLVLRHF